jgi:hypothetical protein
MLRAAKSWSRRKAMLSGGRTSVRAAIMMPTQVPEPRARGRLLQLCATMVISAAVVAGSAGRASAVLLTPFRYEDQARRHCPADVVVWLDFRKGIYYSKRQRRYAGGFTGSFVCREEARGSGYRRSLLGLR